MLKLNSNKEYQLYMPMDEEVIELCNAINALPSLHTIESCCGHNKDPFVIFFMCDGNSMDGLFFLTRCVDRRYFQHDWTIRLEVGDVIRNNILPTTFVLESVSSDGVITKGKEAYKQAKSLVKNMNYHLNHEGFMSGYNLNIDNFKTKISIVDNEK